jgi:ABC-type uncharacterized transport system auxiliary subunit
MRKASLALLALLAAAFLAGCEEGPPKDNSNINEPPAPAPPGGAAKK